MTRAEVLAAVLAEHQTEQIWKAGGWAGDTGCSCGWRMGMWDRKDFPPVHRAHVATALDAALPTPLDFSADDGLCGRCPRPRFHDGPCDADVDRADWIAGDQSWPPWRGDRAGRLRRPGHLPRRATDRGAPMTRAGIVVLLLMSGLVLIRAALAAGERRVTAWANRTGDDD